MASNQQKIRLGIIGLSEGNGHPYSWSAIFNGFDENSMSTCPFSSIPEYLRKQNWPGDQIEGASVTHVWTQDKNLSFHIAAAARIPNVVTNPTDMIGHVDAVLLARDDAEHHREMSSAFLGAGLPVFIDKPFALSLAEANTMLSMQRFPSQIFTCSSLRYADELVITTKDLEEIGGEIKWVEASVMKKWDTYAVHVIEPIVLQLTDRGPLESVNISRAGNVQMTTVQWQNALAYIKVTGENVSPIAITYFGAKGSVTKTFVDSFNCFRKSLRQFIDQVTSRRLLIPREQTLEITEILEWGRR